MEPNQYQQPMAPAEQGRKSVHLPVKKLMGLLFVLDLIVFTYNLFNGSYPTSQSLSGAVTIFSLILVGICVLLIVYGLVATGKKGFIVFGIVLGVLSGAVVFFNATLFQTFGGTTRSQSPVEEYPVNPMLMEKSGSGAIPMSRDFVSYPPSHQTNDITDTREFLKVNYGGHIKSRDVSQSVRDVKGEVRDVGGRIDNENVTEKYGSLSFVVPKSKFDDFRDEVAKIAGAKLYTENVGSQNLLYQKQNIEQNMANATSNVARLEEQKKDIDARHAAAVATINTELTSIKAQLNVIEIRLQTVSNQSEMTALQNEETILLNRQAVLNSNLSTENASYNGQTKSIDAQIAGAKSYVGAVQGQDQKFADNIETVNGSVDVTYISAWALLTIVSPINPWIIIAVLVLILWYILHRKKLVPSIELV